MVKKNNNQLKAFLIDLRTCQERIIFTSRDFEISFSPIRLITEQILMQNAVCY